ncbi:MAG: hypothetical protein EXR72_02445 [Myxococcales bacterium]|nr:hypothetical protein [Myxococcales bacterium]
MAVRKFAISVPEEVMKEVDRAAAGLRTTRSGFVADVLRRVARARSDREITRRVNQLFADPDVAGEQRATAAAFRKKVPREGWEW